MLVECRVIVFHRVKKSNVSYKSVDLLPKEDEVRTLRIYVDRDAESIILPIFGVPVPFHISMIKVLRGATVFFR